MCKDGQEKILFAWAKNAPPTTLPKGKQDLYSVSGIGFCIFKMSCTNMEANSSQLKIHDKPTFR